MSGVQHAMTSLASYGEVYQTKDFDNVMLGEMGLDRTDLIEGSAFTAAKFLLRHHAVAKLNFESVYGPVNLVAMEKVGKLAPDRLWKEFEQECDRRNIGLWANSQPIRDLSELAIRKGNLFQWIKCSVTESGRLQTVFEELTDIRGIGKKIATFIIRDAVWLCDQEDMVAEEDKHLLQCVDVWVGRSANLLWPEFTDTDPDERFQEKAEKITLSCHEYGISGIEYNQGAYYFGREIGSEEDFEDEIRSFIENA